MNASVSRRRKDVSFTMFRRLHLATVTDLWSNLYRCDDVPDQTHFLMMSLVAALECGRFADAVAVSKLVAEQQYGNAETFRLVAQISALVKKVPWIDESLDPDAEALRRYLLAEERCAEFNSILRPLNAYLNGEQKSGLSVEPEDEFVVSLILKAKKHLKRVLGNKPPVNRILDGARFGNGSNDGVRGDTTHFLKKMSTETWTVSRCCRPFALAACARVPAFWIALGLDPAESKQLWADPYAYHRRHGVFSSPSQSKVQEKFRTAFLARLRESDADLITYVPKTADTHRSVGIQPVLNTFVQLGAGDYLMSVLKDKCGIDIHTAQDRVNGPLALLGSHCDGADLSTLDLASASDTISVAVAKLLLPPDWFEFLNCIRTPSYKLPGDDLARRYEKFCAMGNGFCFPLETLIFWSLGQAVYDVTVTPDRLIAVYGDDIVVYQSAALLLIELLEVCGFEINSNKSFVLGPFRESCGWDYFNGINVRPVVLDEVIESDAQLYHYINSLRRAGYENLAARLRGMLPSGKLKRPISGDTCTALEVPMDEFMSSRHARYPGIPSDPNIPWYSCWSWRELIVTAVLDTSEYCEALRLPAALNGAASNDGVACFAHRRKTRTHTRIVACG